ncbi:MAG: hypothetical protein RJA34_617 [Pseudomonadota bacterium]
MHRTPSSWTAIIPLRAGSKGLLGKNTRVLAGKPLYVHAVDVALAAGAARVVISTDIAQVLEAQLPDRVEALARPPELCGDQVPMAPVLVHALQASESSGTVVLLQATSPLRHRDDVMAALRVFDAGDYELVMSVTEADRGVLKWGRLDGSRFVPLSEPAFCFSNRQSLPPVVRPNGAIYVFQAEWFVRRGGFETEHMGVIEMPAQRSLDIDSLADFERCEAALAAIKQGMSS